MVCKEKHLLGLHSLPLPAILSEPKQSEVEQLPEGRAERTESGLPKRLPKHTGDCCCPLSLLPKTLCTLETGPRDC